MIQKTKKHKTQKEQAPNKIYTWTIDFTDLIIWIKKLLNSDWLKAVHFFFFFVNSAKESSFNAKRGNNPSILIGQ